MICIDLKSLFSLKKWLGFFERNKKLRITHES